MKVICFGDSNTYGYDPCSWLGGRYDAENRWVDILAAETGWEVCNWGENGREIPAMAPSIPANTDLLILMLGTNDLLQGFSPEVAVTKLERFLSVVPLKTNQILLIAPPPLTFGEWVQHQALIDRSYTFAGYCQDLAKRQGIRFADAGRWNIPLTYDGVHFTGQGQRTFATKLLEVLK